MGDRSIWDSLTTLWDDSASLWDDDGNVTPPVILPGPGMPYRHPERPRRKRRLINLVVRAYGSGVVRFTDRPH